MAKPSVTPSTLSPINASTAGGSETCGGKNGAQAVNFLRAAACAEAGPQKIM
jgi:hypothetical protein